MENRSEIIKEYFELIIKLNRGNKLPNENTEIEFKIEKQQQDLVFVATLSGSKSKIVLARTRAHKLWIEEDIEFGQLSKLAAQLLNNKNINHTHQIHFFEQVQQEINKDLAVRVFSPKGKV